jgi:hypothetical protein
MSANAGIPPWAGNSIPLIGTAFWTKEKIEKITYTPEKKIAITVVKRDGLLLQSFKDFQDDPDVVNAAIAQNPKAIQFANLRIKNWAHLYRKEQAFSLLTYFFLKSREQSKFETTPQNGACNDKILVIYRV